MIPQVDSFLDKGIIFDEMPSKTYCLSDSGMRVIRKTDGQNAIKQAVRLMLNIERLDWKMFSSNYGVEIKALYGKNSDFAMAELERTVKETLLVDSRIEGVDNFYFEKNGNKVLASFTVRTVFGDFEAEKAVIV